MEMHVTKACKIQVLAMRIKIRVADGEMDVPYDFPGRVGNVVEFVVDGASGRIRNWNQRVQTRCRSSDGRGRYQLLGINGEPMASKQASVAPYCIPSDNDGYPDFQIEKDGTIKGWDYYWSDIKLRLTFFHPFDWTEPSVYCEKTNFAELPTSDESFFDGPLESCDPHGRGHVMSDALSTYLTELRSAIAAVEQVPVDSLPHSVSSSLLLICRYASLRLREESNDAISLFRKWGPEATWAESLREDVEFSASRPTAEA